MTHKLFWEDPYAVRTDAIVTTISGDSVRLDRTVFFAFSGGQESDQGSIGGRRVMEARLNGRDIDYTLEPAHGLQVGDRVTVAIDWDRRYRLMRLHFAAEIVLELAYHALDYPEKTGAHIAADKARIDFNWHDNISVLFPGIMETVRSLVAQDLPITSAFSNEAEERRYWEIPDFARVPCGGTHLRRTGEIGDITLKRRNPGRGKERIEIRLCEP